MKEKILGITFLLILCSCKKEHTNETLKAKIKGELLLSRARFTTFETGKKEKLYQYARVGFDDSVHNKDAGIISYGDSILHQQAFTLLYYSYNPDSTVTNFTQALDGGKIWSVTGNTTNGISGFSAFAPAFPSFLSMDFDTLPVISKSQPYTISWDASVPCDSISIGIYQSHTVAQFKVAGNISSFTFSPTQLSIFEAFFTPTVIIIEGESYKNITVAGIPITVKTYARRNCTVNIRN